MARKFSLGDLDRRFKLMIGVQGAILVILYFFVLGDSKKAARAAEQAHGVKAAQLKGLFRGKAAPPEEVIVRKATERDRALSAQLGAAQARIVFGDHPRFAGITDPGDFVNLLGKVYADHSQGTGGRRIFLPARLGFGARNPSAVQIPEFLLRLRVIDVFARKAARAGIDRIETIDHSVERGGGAAHVQGRRLRFELTSNVDAVATLIFALQTGKDFLCIDSARLTSHVQAKGDQKGLVKASFTVAALRIDPGAAAGEPSGATETPRPRRSIGGDW